MRSADSATIFVRGKKREEQSEINFGTHRAIALKSRENYCNLERLHNQNQPFLSVNRSFIGLHLKTTFVQHIFSDFSEFLVILGSFLSCSRVFLNSKDMS